MIICIPDVLDPAQVRQARALAADYSFVDGRSTAGYRAQRVKNNLQLDTSLPDGGPLVELLFTALANNKQFQNVALPRAMRRPTVSRYLPGMAYGTHSDSALMGRPPERIRSDIAVTLFLSDPATYDGGELVVHSSFGEQRVKLPAGAAVVYPASTLHEVAAVTRGERLAAVYWAQSYVRDALQRELLDDVRKVKVWINATAPESEEAKLIYHVFHNLVRLWSDS
jgi:PKHD-type hydroxylase